MPTDSDPMPPPETVGARATVGSDVVNLFAFFGATNAASAYQEIHSDNAAQTAAARWPLCAEWLAESAPAQALRLEPDR